MMNTEEMLKLKTHSVSATINFCKGLLTEDDDEIEETKKATSIIKNYTSELLKSLITLLELGF